MADFEVKKFTHALPVAVVGEDEQGNTLIRCPQCYEEHPIVAGQVRCPLGEAIVDLLAKGMEVLEAAMLNG